MVDAHAHGHGARGRAVQFDEVFVGDGGGRNAGHADVEQVRRIQYLTQDLGVNLAGVEVIFDLLRELQRLRGIVESGGDIFGPESDVLRPNAGRKKPNHNA